MIKENLKDSPLTCVSMWVYVGVCVHDNRKLYLCWFVSIKVHSNSCSVKKKRGAKNIFRKVFLDLVAGAIAVVMTTSGRHFLSASCNLTTFVPCSWIGGVTLSECNPPTPDPAGSAALWRGDLCTVIVVMVTVGTDADLLILAGVQPLFLQTVVWSFFLLVHKL